MCICAVDQLHLGPREAIVGEGKNATFSLSTLEGGFVITGDSATGSASLGVDGFTLGSLRLGGDLEGERVFDDAHKDAEAKCDEVLHLTGQEERAKRDRTKCHRAEYLHITAHTERA